MSKENKLRFNINDGKPNFRAENKQLTLIFTSHALKTAENKQIRAPFYSHNMTNGQPTHGGLKPREVKMKFKMVLEHKLHCVYCNAVCEDVVNPVCEKCQTATYEFKRNDGKAIPAYFNPKSSDYINAQHKRIKELENMGINATCFVGGGEGSPEWYDIIEGYIESRYSNIDLKGEDEWCSTQILHENPERHDELEYEAQQLICEYNSLVCEDLSEDSVHNEHYFWWEWEKDHVNLSRTLLLRWNTENNKIDGKLISGEFVLKNGGNFYKYVVLFKSFLTDEDVEQLKIPRVIVPVGKAQTAKQFRSSIINRIKSETSNTGLANMDDLDLEKMQWAHRSDDTFLVLSVSKVDKRKLWGMGIDDRFLNGLGM